MEFRVRFPPGVKISPKRPSSNGNSKKDDEVNVNLEKMNLDDLYRHLNDEYTKVNTDVECMLENPAIIEKIKNITKKKNKVISKKDNNSVIDFVTGEDILVDIDAEIAPDDYQVSIGKGIIYNISIESGEKICKIYQERKESFTDIYNTSGAIMGIIASINQPME